MSIFSTIKKAFQKEDKQAAPTQAQPEKDTKKESKGKHGEDFCCGGCS